MSHAVTIEVFEGPIDLLLHLITRQRVDIYEVPLATIARDYLAAVESLPELDLESATGFLVVAAALLELKSARLLPSPAASAHDTGWLEERDLLLARLVECATFREAGTWLAQRLDEGSRFHPRTTGLEARFVSAAPDLLQHVRVDDIVRTAARVLLPPPETKVDTSHVAPIAVSVRDAIARVAADLAGGGRASFRDLCRDEPGRMHIVVRFLALLELYKAGAVDLLQAERFGDIAARWTGHVDAASVAAEVEEYAWEPGPA